MASITVSGSVTGKPNESPVTVKEFGEGKMIATFSVADLEYVPTKTGQDRCGQFYRCTVRGKMAEIVKDRLSRGDKICVSGQYIKREYNGKMYEDIDNARITFLEPRKNTETESKLF